MDDLCWPVQSWRYWRLKKKLREIEALPLRPLRVALKRRFPNASPSWRLSRPPALRGRASKPPRQGRGTERNGRSPPPPPQKKQQTRVSATDSWMSLGFRVSRQVAKVSKKGSGLGSTEKPVAISQKPHASPFKDKSSPTFAWWTSTSRRRRLRVLRPCMALPALTVPALPRGAG